VAFAPWTKWLKSSARAIEVPAHFGRQLGCIYFTDRLDEVQARNLGSSVVRAFHAGAFRRGVGLDFDNLSSASASNPGALPTATSSGVAANATLKMLFWFAFEATTATSFTRHAQPAMPDA
jgi:hypothetical protein